MESLDEVKLLVIRASSFEGGGEGAEKKGVQFHEVEEDLCNKSDLLLQSNPVYKQVPVLVHNGKAVSQSLVICEYIEEAWPMPPLLPDSPYDKALARFWADYINKKFIDSGLKLMKRFGEEHETARKEVVEQFVTLDRAMSAEGPFFLGEKMKLVDVALVPLLPWMTSFLRCWATSSFPMRRSAVVCIAGWRPCGLILMRRLRSLLPIGSCNTLQI